MLEEQLALAQRQEDPEHGRSLAQPVLDAAEKANDLALQAQALACIAECEGLLCRNRSAHALSTRAAQLFQALGRVDEEAGALITLSRASSALGRHETAVEAAFLALELSNRGNDRDSVASAQAQLGLALVHSRSFDAAQAALKRAEAVAHECASELGEFVALVMQGACEAMRVVTLRHETGRMPSLEPARALLERFERFVAEHDMDSLAQPDQKPIQVFMELVSALFHCWRGNAEVGRHTLESTRAWLDLKGVAPWMQSFEAFVRCELAQAEHDLHLAEAQALRILELADASEHEASATLGHLLSCRVFELKGDPSRAAAELKAMAARERRIRSESLSTRHEVVAWQLDMRRSEQSRLELQASAVRLEKLSMEDPLTGIANRRCFEAAAKDCLLQVQDTGKPNCIALLDVDRFKQVNDLHSHGTGDKVLQVVAEILTSHVRGDDLAARLAGDEFVILFRTADLPSAWEACERLQTAVRDYRWEQLSPGLRVTVSVGVAEFIRGDSLETLLHRSDDAMYERKRADRIPA